MSVSDVQMFRKLTAGKGGRGSKEQKKKNLARELTCSPAERYGIADPSPLKTTHNHVALNSVFFPLIFFCCAIMLQEVLTEKGLRV